MIVATPTNYEPTTSSFDTLSVESVIRDVIAQNKQTTIVIKSTVPVGFTQRICAELDTKQVIFSPEFLREGHALHDNLYPSRIIGGEKSEWAKIFAHILAMIRFRRMRTLQKFVSIHSSVHNHFNQERHLYSRENFKLNRAAALAEWRQLGMA